MKRDPAPSIALNVSVCETSEIKQVALTTTDRRDFVEGGTAGLPVDLEINDAVEEAVAAPGAERKLIGAVLNELNPAGVNQQRDKQNA